MKLKDPTIAIPDSFICPISYALMENPVMAADGHSYERSEIAKWLQDQDRSPITNQRLDHKHLVTNWNLKKTIEEFIENANKIYDHDLAEKEEHQFHQVLDDSRKHFVREQFAVENLQMHEALQRSRRETHQAQQKVVSLQQNLQELTLGSAKDKELEAKLESINKQLVSKPFCEKLLNAKAKLLKDLHRYDEALTLLNQAIEHYPQNEYFLTARASLLKKIGNAESAQRDFERAQAIMQAPASGLATRNSVQSDSAARYLPARARERDVESPKRVDRFASASSVKRYPAAARAEVDESSQQATFEIAKNLADSAKLLREQRKFDEALKLSKQALQLAPRNTFIMNGYGDSLAKLGQYQKAIQIFDEVLAINSKDVFALNAKGLAHQHLGEVDKAHQAFAEVITIDPSNRFALANLQQAQRGILAGNSRSFFHHNALAKAKDSPPHTRYNYH